MLHVIYSLYICNRQNDKIMIKQLEQQIYNDFYENLKESYNGNSISTYRIEDYEFVFQNNTYLVNCDYVAEWKDEEIMSDTIDDLFFEKIKHFGEDVFFEEVKKVDLVLIIEFTEKGSDDYDIISVMGADGIDYFNFVNAFDLWTEIKKMIYEKRI